MAGPVFTSDCHVCELHAETTFRVDGMDCANEVAILERRLNSMPGVHGLRADVLAQRLLVAHDAARLGAGAIAQAVAETGMRAFVDHGERSTTSGFDGTRTIFLALSGLFVLAATVASWQGAPRPWIAALSIGAVATSAPWTARRAWASLRLRVLDIHVLMTAAVCGAIALGDWAEAGAVTFLFAVAQWLEVRSLERARHAIRSLMDLAPPEATVRRGDREERVAAVDVRIGDIVLVRPGEKIAADGTVQAGESDVDQAPVTGESVPATKSIGDPVFAGTINGHGALEIRVTRGATRPRCSPSRC
jgi:Cd2+/Zn2+-exporting ATPase